MYCAPIVYPQLVERFRSFAIGPLLGPHHVLIQDIFLPEFTAALRSGQSGPKHLQVREKGWKRCVIAIPGLRC